LPGRGFTAMRVAAWVVPLAFAAGLLLFSLGRNGIHFKALASRHVPNAEAQDLYLKGRYFWERRTPDDLNRAIDYFTQAIVKDPSDAQAYVGLADSYNLLREFGAMPPSEAFPRALSAAQRAVQLDDASAEAHNSLAFVLFWWSWQGAAAEREFKRALELNPNLVCAHHWYGTFLMGLHRYAEALDQMNQAQRLEPSSTAILADKSLLLYAVGRPSESISLLTQLQRTQPSFSSTHDYLGRIYWRQGDYRRALTEWRRMAELRHDELGLAIADAREKGFASGGLPALYEAQLPLLKRLADHGRAYAYNVAVTYAALGNKPQALAYLKTAFDRHEENILVAEPPIPSLQNDPDYQKLRGLITQLLAR
jgi:tetratricopeptide (TPR) repeat protein